MGAIMKEKFVDQMKGAERKASHLFKAKNYQQYKKLAAAPAVSTPSPTDPLKRYHDDMALGFDEGFAELYRSCHLSYALFTESKNYTEEVQLPRGDFAKYCGKILECTPFTSDAPPHLQGVFDATQVKQYQCQRIHSCDVDLEVIKEKFLADPDAKLCGGKSLEEIFK